MTLSVLRRDEQEKWETEHCDLTHNKIFHGGLSNYRYAVRLKVYRAG